jgi:Tc toxin complex TcA C-terminal TcB-binding domain
MATDARLVTYTPLRDLRLSSLLADLNGPDTALLQQIQAALDAAGTDFLARRYQEAISDYRQAATLIWSQLDPGVKVSSGVTTKLPYGQAMLAMLVQTSLNWLGVLPVPAPLSPVSPPGPASGYQPPPADQIGLTAPAVSSPTSLAAASNARLAHIFTAQGSTKAGQQFQTLAVKLDPTVANAILGTTNPPPSPGQAAAASAPEVDSPALPIALTQSRQVGVVVGSLAGTGVSKVASLGFTVGGTPDPATVEAQLYTARVSLAAMPDILAQPLTASDFVLSLPHAYGYVIPVGLGDCYAALGDWANAEASYLQAAAYPYLNAAVEAPQLWAKLASMYVQWGDSLYRGGDPLSAAPAYANVVTQAGGVPSVPLYTTAGLAPGAQLASAIIPQLPQLIASPGAVAATLNPTIATPIVDAYVKLGQIAAGLDFYGYWDPVVPIWTYDYLQQVASQYCQLAVTTEQNVINYWDRADQAQLTRLQLAQHAADTQAAINAAKLQLTAAQAEADAYQQGLALANLRATDAAQNAADYQNLDSQAILYQAESSQVSGGDDGDPDYLNSLADQFSSGQTISGDRGDIAAAVQLVSSRLSLQYEVGSMQRTAAEMQAAAAQAQAEVTAANARVAAAGGQLAIAQLQAGEAQAVLAAFDDSTFSPGVWKTMGDRMYALYRRYLVMALHTAKLMQNAYNFENDTSVALIRADYTADEVAGLLAADTLMADVESFTDNLLATRQTKIQPVKHTLSLATRHSYAFETQFRATGHIEFDTTADDFDLAYPGTYGGRIRHVDVTFQGLLPVSGVSGTLTCGGVSFYRLPTDSWTDQDPSHIRRRVQAAESLVLSDFDLRSDAVVLTGDGGQSPVFYGAGVIGTWVLDVPPEVNDIDYHLITDVLITFIYEARYDPALATAVRQELDSQPGAHTTQVGMPLRWLYPDTFFDLVNNHTATLTVQPSDLPLNQTAATITQVGLLATTSGGHSPAALTIDLTTPGAAAPSAAVTDANGLATSTSAGSPLTAQLGRPVAGTWQLTAQLADNPAWTTNGVLDLTPLANLTLLLEYSYTPRSAG